MKITNVYIRKTDARTVEVDDNNRPARSVVAIHRNEPLTLAIHIFDGTASTQMTQAQLAAYAVSWQLNIAPSPNMAGPLCLQSTSATVDAEGTISVIVRETDTVQAAAAIGNNTRATWTAELTGTPGDSEQPSMVLQWRVAYINRVASENEPPPEAETNNYYPRPVIDAKFADINRTLNIPTDINQLDDADGLLFDGDYNSLKNLPTIPADVADLTDSGGLIPTDLTDLTDTTGILSGKVDAVAGKELSDNNYTDAAVAKVAKIENETLTELTGANVTVAPWTQTKYTADGICTITATGWALSGFQWSHIVITVLADATPAIAGTEEVSEDDALSKAGVYHAAFLNLDGKIYFHVSSFVPAEVEE
ncbi:MAG: hypothetical protein WCR17_04585, partial [Candidatus Methanomethylophilaceae archaeon]